MQAELLLLFESLLLFELLVQLELLLLVEFFYLATQPMQIWSDNKLSAISLCMHMLLQRKKATSYIQILHTDLFSIPAAKDVGNRCLIYWICIFL